MRKLVAAITGGGTQWVGDYLSQGGRSDHFVEAIVPYGQSSFDAFLGKAPDKYCSADTACQMAMRALERCQKLCPGEDIENISGLGVTASLYKENQREGRANVIHISVATIDCILVESYRLEQFNRQAQELVCSKLINTIVTSDATDDVVPHGAIWLDGQVGTPGKYREVYSGDRQFVSNPKNMLNVHDTVIFSSSCNPFHNGHSGMVQYARNKFPDRKILCELSVKNFEKPMVDYISLGKRLASIPADLFDGQIVSNMPTYVEKSVYYAGTTFAMGVDTLNRIDWTKEREHFKVNQVRFLVFPRVGYQLKDDRMYYDPLISFAYDYEPTSISSTELRKQYHQED